MNFLAYRVLIEQAFSLSMSGEDEEAGRMPCEVTHLEWSQQTHTKNYMSRTFRNILYVKEQNSISNL
jgi:hypothetical protein